jgi:hypothetical protein
MAEAELRARADERFEEALRAAGARDPRDFYRDRLRVLKEQDPASFRRALGYFTETLIPTVAREDSDPLAEWLEYGRLLATLTVAGRTVQIDASGRAVDYRRPVPVDSLVLHLPEASTLPALIVGIPPKLSPPQKAAHELLVKQQQG